MKADSCSDSKQKACVLHLVEDCPLCRYEIKRTNISEGEIKGLKKYIQEVEDDRAKWRNELIAVRNDRFAKLEKVTALLSALNELTK